MKIEELLPIIAALGFGIQQFLQVIADPLVSAAISAIKNRSEVTQPGGTP